MSDPAQHNNRRGEPDGATRTKARNNTELLAALAVLVVIFLFVIVMLRFVL